MQRDEALISVKEEAGVKRVAVGGKLLILVLVI